MVILQHDESLMVENEIDLTDSLLRITRNVKVKKGVTDCNHKRYDSGREFCDAREKLEHQIRFIDNALYFIENVVSELNILPYQEVENCEYALGYARCKRDWMDLGYL